MSDAGSVEPDGAAGSHEPTPEAGHRCLVVGVDRSPGADLAVALAARLGSDLDADVTLVHGTMGDHGDPPSGTDLDRWRELLTDAGVGEVRTVVEGDDPVRLLYRIAEKRDAYLIVVGPTQRGELSEFIRGSVAMELAHHGRRPVVIAATEHSEISKS